MNILATGDFHLRTTTPENRTDTSFFETQLDKVEQILQIAIKNNCKYVLQPGDFTDGPRPSFELIEKYVSLFKKYDVGNTIKILHVFGQHDMYYRSKERTATKLFNFLEYLKEINGLYEIAKDIHLYGASWGDEIPKIEDTDAFNILLIHKTVANKPLWNGHNDFLQSDKLFKNNPYDIIINGDYHLSTSYEYKNQIIYNCGCIVRKTIAEASHTPHVLLITINDEDLTYTLKKVELIYKASDEVFKPEALSREVNVKNAKLQEFISNIKNNEISNSLNFRKNLETMMESLEEPVKQILLKELEIINE